MVKPKSLLGLTVGFLAVMLIAVACGDGATSTPSATSTPVIIRETVEVTKEVQVEVTKEVIVTQQVEVTKEVQVEVTKEVQVEVTKEVQVTVIATPTPQPTPVPELRPVTNRVRVGMFFERESNDPLLLRDTIPEVLPMYENLLKYEFDGVDRPMMATGFEASPDAKNWTFFLRDDIIWHRGFGGFTAADIVHTMERAKREIVVGLEHGLSLSIESFDIPDPYTITINFFALNVNVTNAFHNRRASLIQSKAAFDAEGQEGIDNNPVGSGPYRFVRRGLGEFILFERVPYDHWRVNPDFQEIELLVMAEDATRLAAMLAGEIHLAQMSGDLEETAEANGMRVVVGGDVATTLGGLIGGVFFEDGSISEGGVRKGVHPDLPYSDVYHPVTEVPWVHPKVRQAMNKAVNREEFNDVFLNGRGVPMYITWFDKSLRGWNQRWEDEFPEKYGYDPEGARALLAEVEAEIGQPLDWSKTVMPLADRPLIAGLSNMALGLDGYFRAVGIEIPTRTEDFNNVLSRIFDATVGGQLWINGFEKGTDPFYHELLYYSKSGVCCHFYESLEYDVIVEQLREIGDLDERDRLIRQLGDILYDDFAGLPLFWVPSSYVINPAVIEEYRTGGLIGIGDLEDIIAVKQ